MQTNSNQRQIKLNFDEYDKKMDQLVGYNGEVIKILKEKKRPENPAF
jgi:hypothetical protein